MRRTLHIVIIVAAALTLLGNGDRTRRFEKLGHELICTCGCNQILLECNHVGCPSSSAMRDELNAAMDKGGDNDAVLATFVTKYGPTVLAAPTTKGFDRIAWIVPFVVFALSIVVAVYVSRIWRQRAPQPVPAGTGPLPDDLRARIRQETEP